MGSRLPRVYPLNDFFALVTLNTVAATTGTVTAVTTGTVTGFLSTSDGPTATDVLSLTATLVHTGSGVWSLSMDAASLTATLLATNFATAEPFLIVQLSGGIRAVTPVKYYPSRALDLP